MGRGGTRWYKTRLGAGFTLAGGEGGGRRQGERELELLTTCSCPTLAQLEKDELQLGVAEAQFKRPVHTAHSPGRQGARGGKERLPGRGARRQFQWEAGRLFTRC